MPLISWNGQLLHSETPLIRPDSLAVRYGIGVFETIRCYRGDLLFFKDHFSRLATALHTLTIPIVCTEESLQAQIVRLLQHHSLHSARVRVSMLSNGADEPDCLITCTPLPENAGQSVQIDFSKQYGVMSSPISAFKHINYLPFLLAADEASQLGLDDVVLLNQHQRVCETSISNIFCRTGNRVITPSIEEGCIAGVFRKQVLEVLNHWPYDVLETHITPQELLHAEEIFLTNVIRGIRPVASIAQLQKDNSLASQLKQHFSGWYPEYMLTV